MSAESLTVVDNRTGVEYTLPIVDGAICAFHQTKRMPPSAAMKPANAKASARCSVTL